MTGPFFLYIIKHLVHEIAMSNLTEYFKRKAEELPKPKFQMGDRVFGRWNNIPFIGTVGQDVNKQVSVCTDLPIRFDGINKNVIIVPQKDLIKVIVE